MLHTQVMEKYNSNQSKTCWHGEDNQIHVMVSMQLGFIDTVDFFGSIKKVHKVDNLVTPPVNLRLGGH